MLLKCILTWTEDLVFLSISKASWGVTYWNELISLLLELSNKKNATKEMF
jgi:hypothetical protein